MLRGRRQVEFPGDGGQLLRREDEDGELGEAAVGAVGRQDLVVGDLGVVDVLQAPVLEAVDGVRTPVLILEGWRRIWARVWRELMSAARSNRGQDGVPFALPIAKMIFSFFIRRREGKALCRWRSIIKCCCYTRGPRASIQI